jgi:hypothetical protein
MCFNATTSLITFSISILCTGYLLYYGSINHNKCDIFFGIIVLLIGLMQLIEFFLWKNQSCNKNNHFFSLLIWVLLYLQPIINCITYYHLYPQNRFFSVRFITFYYLLYTACFLYILYYLTTLSLCTKPSATSCRLVWAPFLIKQNIFLFYFCFLLYFGFGIIFSIETFLNHYNDIMRYRIRYLFLPITLFISIIYLYYKESIFFISSSDFFGSLWCFLAVFLGIVGVLHI